MDCVNSDNDINNDPRSILARIRIRSVINHSCGRVERQRLTRTCKWKDKDLRLQSMKTAKSVCMEIRTCVDKDLSFNFAD
jgi:hypothetical protein